MKRQALPYLIVLALLVVGLCFAAFWHQLVQKWHRHPLVQLPPVGEVEEMRASLVKSPVGFPQTPEFIVPKHEIPSILRWLEPAEHVSDPPIFPEDKLGTIRITTLTGKQISIQFYWAGKNPAVFTFDGKEYFWGNDKDEDGQWVDGGIRLGKAIRRAFEASLKHAHPGQ